MTAQLVLRKGLLTLALAGVLAACTTDPNATQAALPRLRAQREAVRAAAQPAATAAAAKPTTATTTSTPTTATTTSTPTTAATPAAAKPAATAAAAPTAATAAAATPRIERDVAYGTDAAQKLDFYWPAKVAGAPIILMVHGGGWFTGDKAAANVVDGKVARFVARGAVFVSTNYRLNVDPLSQAADVAQALAFVQKYATERGADSSKLILMGHSAGGHLAGVVASDTKIASAAGVQPWLGTVVLDGQMDIVRRMENSHERFLDKVFGSDPAYWRAASPIYQLSTAPRPVLLVCSQPRGAESCPQARQYAAAVRRLGGQAKVLAVQLDHEQINADLGTSQQYTQSVENFLQSLGVSI